LVQVSTVDIVVWLLAGMADCGACGQPLTAHSASGGRRFYRCPGCRHQHCAETVEHIVAATVRERDWMLAQQAHTPHQFADRWRAATRTDIQRHLRRLLTRVVIAAGSERITLHWPPHAVLDPDSPWLGFWIGPPAPDRHPIQDLRHGYLLRRDGALFHLPDGPPTDPIPADPHRYGENEAAR
jgi:hypothetical protein